MRATPDEAGDVEPVEFPVLEPGQKLFEFCGPVIILAPPLIGRRHVPLGHPVDLELVVGIRLLRNRVADEFQDFVAGHDHGAAGQEGTGFGDAAPKNPPVPDWRSFLRIELFADRGVDAISCDQQGAVVAAYRPAGRLVDEIGAYAVSGLGPAREVMAGENVRFAQPLGRGIEQDLLQRAAMDRELRPFVTGLDAARLAPDRLAVLGKIRQFLGAHGGRVEPVVQAEFDQLPHRMRQHVDTDPERPQFGHALKDAHWCADLVQAERQRQAADAAARDENRHDTPSKRRSIIVMVMTWERGHGQPRKARRSEDGRRRFRPLTSGDLERKPPCTSSITPPALARSPRISRWRRPVPITAPCGWTSSPTSSRARNISR